MESEKINQVAAEKLRQCYPEVYEECERLVDSPLSDLSLLPGILVDVFTHISPSPANSAFILAVVYYLYAPYKLHLQNIRSCNGIRDILCAAFRWKDKPTVNHYQKAMIVYYKNPRWAAKVKEVADNILEKVTAKEVQHGN